jgi:hypothetical protein
MKKISGNLLFISLFFLCAGSAIGWAIVKKLSGEQAGSEFLRLSFIFAVIVYFVQVTLFFMSRQRLFLQISFTAAFGISLFWFMLSFSLPIFWMEELGQISRISIFSLSIILFAVRAHEGASYFEAKWRQNKTFVSKYYNSNTQVLDWEKFVSSFGLAFSLFPRGVPVWTDRVLTVLLVISMIVGLNLRKVYPVFSVFAWGIPCIIASAALIQITTVNVMQALKVIALEKTMGVKIGVAIC